MVPPKKVGFDHRHIIRNALLGEEHKLVDDPGWVGSCGREQHVQFIEHGAALRMAPGDERLPAQPKRVQPREVAQEDGYSSLPPPRRRRDRPAGRRETLASWGSGARRRAPWRRRSCPPGSSGRTSPGAGDRRPGGHARRDGRSRRRPGAGQPARAGGPRDRPLGPGRPVRDAATRSPSTWSASTSATASATSCCAGPRRPSETCGSSRPGPGIVHQVNLEYLATVVADRADDATAAWPSPTRSSAPTRTRRWSTASACWATASAASRPRRSCSASRSTSRCRGSSACGFTASCRRARPPPTSSSW